MRLLIQRVSEASVSIEQSQVACIGTGLLVLLGIAPSDTTEDIEWLATKLSKLRLFADPAGLMNCSLTDLNASVLVVSQFTLFASTRKGTRPSFNNAAPPVLALPLYEAFIAKLQQLLGNDKVQSGRFGAMMAVSLVNDGPVTLLLDSQLRE